MDYRILQKGNLDNFIRALSSKMKVVAPVKRGYDSYSFEEINNSRDISLKYIPTILPPKNISCPSTKR